GEGGEARSRNDAPERPWGPFWEKTLAERAAHPEIYALAGDLRRSRFRSRIRQVASGRFGVDAEYLMNSDELQIKMAQGAKPGADVIEIDGIDGGTGAAMLSSKEHAGLPTEMGLAEAHQALVTNGLRTAVQLRAAGGIKNGYDVVKYALFGADQFTFGQGLM